MSEFNTSKNKLQKLWQDVISNKSQINEKATEDAFSFFNKLLNQQHIKIPIEIYNSGEIYSTPSIPALSKTASKSEVMPTLVSYSKLIDLEIPEIFLPFVKYSVEVQPVPDTDVHGVYEYDPSDWAGDYIKIKGDGKLIFAYDINDITSVPSVIGSYNGSQTFPLSYFTDNNINLDMTKEVWSAVIVKNDTSQVNGNVTRIVANITDSEETFTVNAFINPDHKIISLTSTSFTAIGDHYDILGDVLTEDVQRTYTFSALDSYYFMINEAATVLSEDIDTQAFTKLTARWLFWSNLLQKSFVLEIEDIQDGDKFEITPNNFPDTDDDDNIPYTAITLQRNIAPYTDVPTEEKLSESASHISTWGEDVKSITTTDRQFKNYVKISDSNASIPKYRFKLNGSLIITARSTVLSPNTTDFPVYNDIYTQVGTTYSLTTEDHELLLKEVWIPTTEDVILNIKAYLINPLYWREQREYKNGI